jgi:DNA repair exonuclease SbcCD ATPase subunit
MKAIIYVVAIVVAIGSSVFTYRHWMKFEALQKDRLATIAENKNISADADYQENKLKKEKETLASSEQKLEEVTQSLTVAEATGATLKREGAELEGTLKEQEQEFAELNKTMDEVNKILGDLGGDITIDNVGDKVAEIDADKKAKQEKLEETQTLIGAADKSLANNRAEVDRLAKKIIERNARIGRNAMEAVITSVDQDWGFLVIGAGSNTGFSPQTGLLVMRDGRMIGRVRPSSIELNQTIAEIDFKSLAAGVRIQPGDRVMLAKPNFN